MVVGFGGMVTGVGSVVEDHIPGAVLPELSFSSVRLSVKSFETVGSESVMLLVD